jgi:hypothetical protein
VFSARRATRAGHPYGSAERPADSKNSLTDAGDGVKQRWFGSAAPRFVALL